MMPKPARIKTRCAESSKAKNIFDISLRNILIFSISGRPPVGELKKVGKSRIFWQKVGGFFTKVGKGRIIFSLF